MNKIQAIAAALLLTETGGYAEVEGEAPPPRRVTCKVDYDGDGTKGGWDKCVAKRKRHLDARKRQRQARKKQRRK